MWKCWGGEAAWLASGLGERRRGKGCGPPPPRARGAQQVSRVALLHRFLEYRGHVWHGVLRDTGHYLGTIVTMAALILVITSVPASGDEPSIYSHYSHY